MQQPTRTYTLIPLALLALLALTVLGGCGPQAAAADDDPFVVADLFATPGKSLATLVLSPTPEPTATVHNAPTDTPAPTLPLPTAILLQPTMPLATPGPTPTRAIDARAEATPTSLAPVCEPPPAPFAGAWAAPDVQATLGCPAGTAQTVNGVWQTYEHGVMFWREQDRSIFVLSNLAIGQGQPTDSWWRFDDTYQEGEPEDSMGLSPPPGMSMPVRGFGKVWRSNGFVRDALGWATSGESGMQSTWLQFESGWMMTGPDGRPVYALVPTGDPPHSTGFHYGALAR